MPLYQFECRPVQSLGLLAATLSPLNPGFDPKLLPIGYVMEKLVSADFSPTTWVFPYQ